MTIVIPTLDLRCGTGRLVLERVKIFSDGSLGAETAAMRLVHDTTTPTINTSDIATNDVDEPIASSIPTYKGVLMHETEVMRNMITVAKRSGYRLEIHAIGDAAAEQVHIII